VALVGLSLGAYWFSSTLRTPVEFLQPQISTSAYHNMPDGISSGWLVDAFKEALREEVGTIEIVGAVGAERSKTLYSATAKVPVPPKPEYTLAIDVHCQESLCVLSVTKHDAKGRWRTEQNVLLSAVTATHWRNAVESLTASLFD